MTKLTGAALDRAVAQAMGLKSVNNCEKWGNEMDEIEEVFVEGFKCAGGIKTSNQRIEFSASEGFGTWLTNPLKTVDGLTVGECNRASLHRRLDAWLDGTWREAT